MLNVKCKQGHGGFGCVDDAPIISYQSTVDDLCPMSDRIVQYADTARVKSFNLSLLLWQVHHLLVFILRFLDSMCVFIQIVDALSGQHVDGNHIS